MSDNQTAKTLVHEYAHHLLHFPRKADKPRDEKEIEAESVAFIVCAHYGVETDDYSLKYLASWSAGKDKKAVKALGAVIQKAAAKIIDSIGEMPAAVTTPPTIDIEYTVSVSPVAVLPAPKKSKPHKSGQKITFTIVKRDKERETVVVILQ